MLSIYGGLKYPDGVYPRPCPCGRSDCWLYAPVARVSS